MCDSPGRPGRSHGLYVGQPGHHGWPNRRPGKILDHHAAQSEPRRRETKASFRALPPFLILYKGTVVSLDPPILMGSEKGGSPILVLDPPRIPCGSPTGSPQFMPSGSLARSYFGGSISVFVSDDCAFIDLPQMQMSQNQWTHFLKHALQRVLHAYVFLKCDSKGVAVTLSTTICFLQHALPATHMFMSSANGTVKVWWTQL